MFRAVPKVHQPDKIVAHGNANINQGRETSASAPPETVTSFHLTLKLAISFQETTPRSKISCSFEGTVSGLKNSRAGCKQKGSAAAPNFCMKCTPYASFWRGSEAALKSQNAVKQNEYMHDTYTDTQLFPSKIRVKGKGEGWSQGDSVHSKAGKIKIKSPKMHNYCVSTPNQPFLYYLSWTQLSNQHWRGLSLILGLELLINIKLKKKSHLLVSFCPL